MIGIPIHIIRFILFALAQGLVFGQLDFGFGIHPMIYPLFILMLPFDLGAIALMVIAFMMGISIDFFMNTFGLHASSAVIIAYFRPELFKLFSPRDGYESFRQPSASDLGYKWFLSVAGLMILIHHVWFFFLEYFKLSEWMYILQKSIFSGLFTLLIFVLIQIIFFKKQKAS